MKIIYLLTTPDAGAGTEKTVLTQASLMAADHRVSVVGVFRTADAPHFELDKRAKVRYLVDARRGKQGPASTVVPKEWDDQFNADSDRAIAAYLRKVNADIVVTTTPALAYLAARYLPSRVPLVHQEHRSPMSRSEALMAPLVAARGRISLLANLTQRSQDYLSGMFGDAAPSMVVVPNPLDPGFRPRSSLTSPLIVSAGRLAPGKNYPDLVRAFAVANELHPGWRLRIYGDGPERGKINTTIRHHDLVGLVDVVPSTRRVTAEFSKASIFAMTSLAEGQSLVAVEAAAAGLPVVSYDIEVGPREIIGAAGGGILVPPRSPDAMGAALATLMDDPELLGDLSERALEGIEPYSAAAVRARWNQVFDAVVSGDGTAQAGITPARQRPHGELVVMNGARLAESSSWRSRLPARGELAALEAQIEGVLTGTGLPRVTVPSREGPDAHVFADEHRDTVLAAVQAAAGRMPWSLRAYRHRHQLTVDPWTSAEDAPLTLRYATHISVSSNADETSAPHPSRSVFIEFWASSDDGVRRAPRPNANAEWVSEQVWMEWMARGGASIGGSRVWERDDFPIDVVFTWVDGNDPEWLNRKAAHSGEVAAGELARDSVSQSRFRNRNEIFYAVSSVKRFMPWVRNTFIVTDRQVPADVLAAYPDVVVVDHAEIFPDPSDLPVFNSHAIEACIHRIPGLAEHFIYMNDDVLIARPQNREQYFSGNGVARFFPSSVKINHGAADEFPHLAAAANNRAIVQGEWGFEITRSMLHTPHPHRRSVIESIERQHPQALTVTRANRFRAPNDVSLLSSLAQYYGFGSGAYAEGRLNYAFVSLRGAGLLERLSAALKAQRLDIIALGEPRDHEWRDPQELEWVTDFMRRLTL